MEGKVIKYTTELLSTNNVYDMEVKYKSDPVLPYNYEGMSITSKFGIFEAPNGMREKEKLKQGKEYKIVLEWNGYSAIYLVEFAFDPSIMTNGGAYNADSPPFYLIYSKNPISVCNCYWISIAVIGYFNIHIYFIPRITTAAVKSWQYNFSIFIKLIIICLNYLKIIFPMSTKSAVRF